MSDVRSFDGTRLALETWGPPDAPVLVLVPGLGLSTDSWGRVPELLADRYRVVAYDLRGHGQSGDARSADYSMAAHARDLGAVLDAVVPAGERAVVVGHSFGGGVLLAHAESAGTDRVAGAVFAGSGGSAVTVPGFPARGWPDRAEKALRRAWLAVLRAGVHLGRSIRPVRTISDRIIRKFAFAPGEPDELVAQVRNSFFGSRPRALSGTALASVSHDGIRLAPALTVPTLVVRGEHDPEVPEDDARELVDALPDAELVTVPGAGHMLPLTNPDVVAEQVARWVEQVRPTTPDRAAG